MSVVILYRMLRGIFRATYRVKVSGLHNIPDEGAYLLCPNHLSNLDPPFVVTVLEMKTHFMAKKELFRYPGFREAFLWAGAFPVDREKGGRRAMKTATSLLQQGKPVCLFPEGKRNRREMGEFKTGAVRLASQCGCPIVPIGIVGTYRPFSPLYLVIGEAYVPDPSLSPTHQTDELRRRVETLRESVSVPSSR